MTAEIVVTVPRKLPNEGDQTECKDYMAITMEPIAGKILRELYLIEYKDVVDQNMLRVKSHQHLEDDIRNRLEFRGAYSTEFQTQL